MIGRIVKLPQTVNVWRSPALGVGTPFLPSSGDLISKTIAQGKKGHERGPKSRENLGQSGKGVAEE